MIVKAGQIAQTMFFECKTLHMLHDMIPRAHFADDLPVIIKIDGHFSKCNMNFAHDTEAML